MGNDINMCCQNPSELRTLYPEEDFKAENTVDQTRKGVVTEKSDVEKNESRLLPVGKDKAFRDRAPIILDEETLTKRKNILAKIVNEVEELTLKIVNSNSNLLKGQIFLINAQGLINKSERNKQDGFVYFGHFPENQLRETHDEIDFNLPLKLSNKDDKNIGRYFQIEYNLDKKKYFIKDLWIGYGTFLRFDFPITLKDNHLINIGESFLIANILKTGLDNSKESNKLQLKIKVFGVKYSGETFYFPTDKDLITIGRLSVCDIQIQDKLLSKIHCCIKYKEPYGWSISDGYENCFSTNGSWLYLNEEFEIFNKMVFKSNQTIFQVSL